MWDIHTVTRLRRLVTLRNIASHVPAPLPTATRPFDQAEIVRPIPSLTVFLRTIGITKSGHSLSSTSSKQAV